MCILKQIFIFLVANDVPCRQWRGQLGWQETRWWYDDADVDDDDDNDEQV